VPATQIRESGKSCKSGNSHDYKKLIVVCTKKGQLQNNCSFIFKILQNK